MMETIIILGIIVIISALCLYGINKNNKGMKTLGKRISNLELLTKTLKAMNEKKPNTYNKKKKRKYYRPKQSVKKT
tara:strand:- start:1491 stop:1718 length:228 start_codon:yes stop_codon:yes gene_type:complete